MLKELSKNRKAALYCVAVLLLAASNLYCYKAHFEEHLKLRDYTVSDQLLYNPSFIKEGYASDALIRAIVWNKKVAVPRGLTPYEKYPSYGHMHDEGNPFSCEYFWENNYIKYLSEYASEIEVDTALPDLYELAYEPLPDEVRGDFELLGPGNDMMRYAHMGDHTDEETSNQFYYTYFYTVNPYHPGAEELQIRICTDRLSEDGQLVALWDTGENLYLMSRAYYDEHVAGGYE
ncbi:MAG: hypothetical protein K6G42_00450 [Lachnospiraceae bacterium]|nr:hypothetical protein [Lachnospiraceae bacterium]